MQLLKISLKNPCMKMHAKVKYEEACLFGKKAQTIKPYFIKQKFRHILVSQKRSEGHNVVDNSFLF